MKTPMEFASDLDDACRHVSGSDDVATMAAMIAARDAEVRQQALDDAEDVIQRCREEGETDHRSMKAGIRALGRAK